jgi:hypothetical protein
MEAFLGGLPTAADLDSMWWTTAVLDEEGPPHLVGQHVDSQSNARFSVIVPSF